MDLAILASISTVWSPIQVSCPVGLLFGARCPGRPPDVVLASFRAKEIEHASTLVPSRQREWLAGRLCLRAGLVMCSAPETDLLPLPSGAPYVPPGARGSISHKKSLAFAIVSPGDAPCGIDIEEIEERDDALVQRIMTARERAVERSAATASLYFSAKEAVYKLLSSDMQPAIDFEDIELMPAHEADGWTELQGLVDGSLAVRVHANVAENMCLAVATLL